MNNLSPSRVCWCWTIEILRPGKVLHAEHQFLLHLARNLRLGPPHVHHLLHLLHPLLVSKHYHHHADHHVPDLIVLLQVPHAEGHGGLHLLQPVPHALESHGDTFYLSSKILKSLQNLSEWKQLR